MDTSESQKVSAPSLVRHVMEEVLYSLTEDERNAEVKNPQKMVDVILAIVRVAPTVSPSTDQPAAIVNDNNPVAALTNREQQVMKMLASGNTNREIAQQLEISIKTVDTHRGHLMKKLGVRNNSDLTRFAIKHGLISLDEQDNTPGNANLVDTLTSRQHQVMVLLARGNTNREIAQNLDVSIKTIDTHRGHVMKRLKVRNNSELTRFAIKHNHVLL